ncbi:hypothetical protein [Paraburkholderia susongensis]|uniref:Lipoprotein n=1 Tax=Paraburkholderia susongensis TaxID=1515439 RepID=A0A1X7LNN2_9BURK|nr:hypothetical protein [Paraburkholderia susongensis]SMG55481.1 hypothetical protein SAMN06265784_107250 [Paraburkholderia susongensis]
MQHMILPPLTGVFAAAMLAACTTAPYDTSMNSCDQEYVMTNPAGAEYYCGASYEYLYGGGFVDIDRFRDHHHDHDHDHDFAFHRDHDQGFHHGGAMAAGGHGAAHGEGHGGGHDSSGFGSDFQSSGASGSHGGGAHK